MKLKSYIPFLTVPLSIALLSALIFDASRGQFDLRMDIPRYVFWSVLSISWLISGAIKWNTPYISADNTGLTVRNRSYSNRPSLVLPWTKIRRHTGRKLSSFGIESSEGKIIKIPINGMSGRALQSLLFLIEEKTKNANPRCDRDRDAPCGAPLPHH